MIGEYVSLKDRQQLLNEGLVFDKVTLASGVESGVKFDFEKIVRTNKRLFDVAVHGIADCVRDNYDPDDYNAILTVGNGANVLGEPLARMLKSYHIPTRKNGKDLYVPERLDQETTAVIINDVYTTGASLERAKAAFDDRASMDGQFENRESGPRMIGAAVLLNRSQLEYPVLSDGTQVRSAMWHVL